MNISAVLNTWKWKMKSIVTAKLKRFLLTYEIWKMLIQNFEILDKNRRQLWIIENKLIGAGLLTAASLTHYTSFGSNRLSSNLNIFWIEPFELQLQWILILGFAVVKN
jgi:hypothetical protein